MTARKKPTKRAAARGKRSLYAYSVPVDRIRALAADLSDGDELTVLSPRRLDGLNARRLERVALRDGRHAVALTENVGGASPVQREVSRTAFEPDARGRAILRGLEYARLDLSESGGSYSLDEVRTVLGGISRQAVDKRVKDGSLLAVPGPSNRRRYPTFQFDGDGDVLVGLKDVQAALPTRNAWAVLNFLINPQDGLNGLTPASALRSGKLDAVVASARRLGEQGG